MAKGGIPRKQAQLDFEIAVLRDYIHESDLALLMHLRHASGIREQLEVKLRRRRNALSRLFSRYLRWIAQLRDEKRELEQRVKRLERLTKNQTGTRKADVQERTLTFSKRRP